MQLLVAVKKRRTGIVRRKIHLNLLPGGNDDYVFPDARRSFAGEPGQFEAVPVQMHRVGSITLVVEAKTVPTIGVNSNGIGLGEGFPVDGPVIHPVMAGKLLKEDEWHEAARGFGSFRMVSKNRAIPGSRWQHR